MKYINAEIFTKAVGREPEQDDIERCNCVQVGKPGHLFCGWCDVHDKPVFMCGCQKPKI